MDEHIPDAVSLGLRRRGVDVTTTVEAGLRGAPDEEQILFALRASRIIVSHDSDMLRIASGGAQHAGIAYCHSRKYKLGQLVLKLLALANRVGTDSMNGRIEFL